MNPSILNQQPQRFRSFKIGIVSSLALLTYSQAATYYVSSAGNDTNNGTSSTTPWKTIGKVNTKMSTFLPNDQILFKRAETFRGTLSVTKSGSSLGYITFGAYGAGVEPILTGSEAVTGWTAAGANKWVANVTTPPPVTAGIARPMTVVTVNSVLKPLGRTPNAGYLYYESQSGNNQITDLQLPTGTWTGAEAVVRLFPWMHERRNIIAQPNTTTLTTDGYSAGIEGGAGYFLQNSLATLDAAGEWFYDAAATPKKLYLYQTTSPTAVEACARVNVVTLANSTNWVRFLNLDLRSAQSCLVTGTSLSNILIDACKLRFAGGHAVLISSSSNIAVRNSTITDCVNNGIVLGVNAFGTAENCNASEISSNIVQNIALNAGMNQPGNGQTFPIQVVGNQSLIVHNLVNNVAGHGILFTGSNHQVTENKVSNFATVVDDVGGIYTAWEPGSTGNQIVANIVLDGIGAPTGKVFGNVNSAEGIYLDEQADNIHVQFNTVARCGGSGIFIHDCHGGIIEDNLIFDNRTSQIFWASDTTYQWNPVTQMLEVRTPAGIDNFTLARNHFVALRESANCMTFSSIYNGYDMPYYGTFTNNVYAHPFRQAGRIVRNFLEDPASGEARRMERMTVAEWQAFSGQDAGSTGGTVNVPFDQAYNYLTANLVANGNFDTVTTPWECWTFGTGNPPGTNGWVGNNTAMTGGSAYHSYASPASTFNSDQYARLKQDLKDSNGLLIPFAATDRVLVRFRSQATRLFGVVDVALYGAPVYNPQQSWGNSFGEAGWGAEDNSVILTMQAASTGACINFGMDRWSAAYDNDSSFWLDNVSVRKVTDNLTRVGVTDNVATAGRIAWFYYNTTGTNATYTFAGTRYTPDGGAVTSPITIGPFEGLVLLEN